MDELQQKSWKDREPPHCPTCGCGLPVETSCNHCTDCGYTQKECDAHAAEHLGYRCCARCSHVKTNAVQVAGDYMTISLAQFEQRASALLADEQRKTNPDNALIAFICEAVRLSRENIQMAKSGILRPPVKTSPTSDDLGRIRTSELLTNGTGEA